MEQTMRWFGPQDPVSLWDIRQAGCTGVVTALHHQPPGAVWPLAEIENRCQAVAAAGLTWTVVESLPVSEAIKQQQGPWQAHIGNYQQSIQNLAACGIKVVTYNFMPVLDWMRTDLSFALPDGSRALRFDKAALAAFDLFLLERPGAEASYTAEEQAAARLYFEGLNADARNRLYRDTLQGLPGAGDSFTRGQMLAHLANYTHLGDCDLRQHLYHFLRQVVPVAEAAGIRLAIHPDDPPFPILGLPRVVSTEADARALIAAAPSPANGLCFCTGSYGARPDNDLAGMVRRLGNHIHFLHLRATRGDGAGSFFEADHLDGDVDMYAVVKELVLLMRRRQQAIPMRPDHGHQMLDDLKKSVLPGYSAIGRLRGLAELRGLELGIQRALDEGIVAMEAHAGSGAVPAMQ